MQAQSNAGLFYYLGASIDGCSPTHEAILPIHEAILGTRVLQRGHKIDVQVPRIISYRLLPSIKCFISESGLFIF